MAGNDNNAVSYRVYTYRWVIVLSFVAAGVANALVLLSWSPISDLASDYWDGLSISLINLLAVTFQVLYLPGTMLSLKAMQVGGLRYTMLLGGALTFSGCFFRWLATYVYENDSDMDAIASYVLVLFGTCLVALAQPFYLNMPAKIASTWFSISERDVSTTLCSLANPLGSALGSILPAMFVTENDANKVDGVSQFMEVQMIVAAAILGFTFFAFRKAPPSPPSPSAATAAEAPSGSGKMLKANIVSLLTNHEYVKVLFAFTIALGQLNAVAALINQLPGDYSNGEAGTVGAVLILCGFLGAFITGFILNHFKSYKEILQRAYVLATLAWIFFVSNCRSNNFPLLVTSAGLLGLTLLPVIPATIVNAVEYAYPIGEDLSVGSLYVFANTAAIACTFIGQSLLSKDSFGPAPLFPFGLWVIGSMVLALIPILTLQGEYLRLQTDTIGGGNPSDYAPLLSDTA